MKKLGLLPKLVIGIILGILIGSTKSVFLTKLLVTFSGVFGNFLNYIVPFLIIAFVAPGIAELGSKAGKLLGITTILAYTSTIVAGSFAFFAGSTILPKIINTTGELVSNGIGIEGFFQIEIPAMMGVMTALVTAFVLGLGMSVIKGNIMLSFMQEFREIIEKVIKYIIIPFLPIHIAGIFANMAYSGEVAQTLAVFSRVFALVISLQIIYLIIQYITAGALAKTNPFVALKNMIPAYFTAVGTQSSAATIPVTVNCTKKNNVTDEVADFVIPLCATIHLAGSTITLTICSIAVLGMNGVVLSFAEMLPFIMMLGVTMVAAPGVPGGAVMAALGLLETMLGFTDGQLALMMALYMAQDSFGTATNVTGDAAIALIVDKFANK